MADFRPGDRVQYINPSTWVRDLHGQIGTVQSFSRGSHVWVKFDQPTKPLEGMTGWNCPVDSLELIEQTPFQRSLRDYIKAELV